MPTNITNHNNIFSSIQDAWLYIYNQTIIQKFDYNFNNTDWNYINNSAYNSDWNIIILTDLNVKNETIMLINENLNITINCNKNQLYNWTGISHETYFQDYCQLYQYSNNLITIKQLNYSNNTDSVPASISIQSLVFSA